MTWYRRISMLAVFALADWSAVVAREAESDAAARSRVSLTRAAPAPDATG